ncbi:ArsR/SmtB family transcription factor [Spelaeicoccus albus]|uniref:DNA-binding transcriptional ArsR family regulator n=1 Tax=Spelaeicoccus albus TaxID=1280376 RepID=A0A7Z0D1M9_9MICO|nr:metalloregulator ArsR/SmtB family transcription factor [Spelaeicoccus albus]NYI67343.1 DNA-binding transcriptional ArsR family regulator [Spelaeicoccus albus]
MDALEAIGDPVRRRIVELLTDGERTAGDLARAVGDEYGISQPATSRHLRILRESGVVASAVNGQQRQYSLQREPLDEIADWLSDVRAFWNQRLDALDTELRRGRRNSAARDHHNPESTPGSTPALPEIRS